MKDADGVERDVYPTGFGSHRVGVLIDGSLVKSVNFRRLGRASRGGDLSGHVVELGESAPGKEYLRSLTGEGTGYRAANRATATVNHRVLTLKQHC